MNPRDGAEHVSNNDTVDCLRDLTSEIDESWIGDALRETGRQDVRARKLPAFGVLWIVIGMGLFRDRSVLLFL